MRWHVLRSTAALWVNSFTIGLMYFSISSLSGLIGAELGFSDLQLSVLFSLPTFAYVVTGWFPGAVVDRLGIKRSVTLVFTLIWLPALCKVAAASYALFVALTAVQSVGILLSAPCTSKCVKELASPSTARVVGLVNTGMMIGTWCTHTFALKIAGRTGGWRGATLVFLFCTLLLGLPSIALLVTAKSSAPAALAKKGTGAAQTAGLFTGSKRQRMILAGISLLYFGTLATSFALNNWLPKLLTYGGFSPSASAASASAFALGSLISSLVIPLAAPRILDLAPLPVPAALFAAALLVSLSWLRAPFVVLLVPAALGLVIALLQLVVQYQTVANCSSAQAGKYSSFVYFVGNIGATLSIAGVGFIPESLFAPKILFIALFSLAGAAGGWLFYLGQKQPSASSHFPGAP